MITKQPADKKPTALALRIYDAMANDPRATLPDHPDSEWFVHMIDAAINPLVEALEEIEHHALQGLNHPGEERERLRTIRSEIECATNRLARAARWASEEGN